MKIGVFDSGVGGLSVLKSLIEARFFDEIIYYGDTARVPYGVKDKDTIVRFSLEALEFFKPFKIDMLIVACNTVSAYALRALRQNASFPVLGVIDAGVLAVQNALKDKNSQILVLGTRATIASRQYQKRLMKVGFRRIEALATGLFVPMVEEGIFEGELVQSAFEHYFKPLNLKLNSALKTNLSGENLANKGRNSRTLGKSSKSNATLSDFGEAKDLNIDALILGCTHFPLLSKALQGYFGDKTKLIHSGDAIVSQLQSEFKLKRKKIISKVKFYASSDIKALKKTAKSWLKM